MGKKNKCDKNLTEHCSLLDNVVPGDTILADCGFDISDSVGFRCSKLEQHSPKAEHNSVVLKWSKHET